MLPSGAAGLTQNELSLDGLRTILRRYDCTGSEENLTSCPTSSLAVCDGSIAAVGCQGGAVQVASLTDT